MTHLHEPERIQVLPDVVDDPTPGDEDLLDVVVHDQIDVSLPVPDLCIGQTSIGDLGQHVETGGEEDDVLGRDGEFSLLGSGGGSGDSDDITSSEESVDLVELLLVLGFPEKGSKRMSIEWSITAIESTSIPTH
jgi:hypothetical protein